MKILIFVLIWLALFSLALLAPRWVEPSGDSFTRGLNRLPLVLGLHGLALIVAIFTAALSYRARVNLQKWCLVVGLAPLVIELSGAIVLLLTLMAAIFLT